MDLLYPERPVAWHSESDLSNMRALELSMSLKRHSHFFVPPPRCRPRSVPLSPVDTAGQMLTVLDGSSSERIDRDSVEAEGGVEGEDIMVAEKEGIRFENRASLAHDLQFLANMPELCDVTFLVGRDRQPVCGVKAIMAARSRVFRRLLFAGNRKPGKKKVSSAKPPDGYIEKYDLRGNPVVVVMDFEPMVFKLLIDYIHSGSVMLQARSLLGLMNAADHYGLEDLKLACIRFMEHCITIDTVCCLLTSAEKYIQYKSTKILVQKMFEFVDINAERILSLGAFQQLPQHVVRIVLGREDLQAMEITKFNAAYRWTLHHVDEHPEVSLKEGFEPFVDVINFVAIPAKELMQNVRRADVVEDRVILNALAMQADPSNITDGVRQGQRLRKTATVPSDMEGRNNSPSPQLPHRQGRVRRAQSSKQSLSHVAEVSDVIRGTTSPSDSWQHGATSVPSLDMVGVETGTRPIQNSTETTPPLIQDSQLHDTRTVPTSGANSPPMDTDSNHDDSNHGDSNEGSLSSLGMEGESPILTSSPVNLNRQRQYISYNTLDMIVTASNPDNTPVNV